MHFNDKIESDIIPVSYKWQKPLSALREKAKAAKLIAQCMRDYEERPGNGLQKPKQEYKKLAQANRVMKMEF